MNTRNTIEISIKKNTKKETATVEIKKPDCKNGVCSLNWKPVKPNLAA